MKKKFEHRKSILGRVVWLMLNAILVDSSMTVKRSLYSTLSNVSSRQPLVAGYGVYVRFPHYNTGNSLSEMLMLRLVTCILDQHQARRTAFFTILRHKSRKQFQLEYNENMHTCQRLDADDNTNVTRRNLNLNNRQPSINKARRITRRIVDF